jgi:gamma-glutamyltranspeptidase/glutathione hydrolase
MAVLQILNILENCNVAAMPGTGADYLHLLVEATRLAFADRDAFLSDPRFVAVPLAVLLAKDYAAGRRRLIDMTRAAKEVKPGLGQAPAFHTSPPGGDTVYFCAADPDGLVVSAIQSIYFDFGSGLVAGDTGILMHNRGSFFSLDERHPNRLEGGKRPFHTIIPGMVLAGGRPVLAFGTMGGEGQPQTQSALLTRILDLGYAIQAAIDAPRWLWGRSWGSVSRDLLLESRIPGDVAQDLARRGHSVRRVEAWSDAMGHAQAIRIGEDGSLEGGADPRGDGVALGF